ncbi:hypothetical protein PGT21_001488 [Puccinia graminis f. sp. tritici]|uniref:Uncharacterized protein n=1 Tax=Puccinia graminis f. sp. tritici TaxID=56615 RepID=A0A5B0QMA1_PUCGR|nr:hypothetical protein PGT21_001488 [Puccinia graminis f. sp. tritici]
MDSGARRLTRSTYIGELIPTNGTSNDRKRRSSSTDSENGWIPPPPLLPLTTKFLITNPQTPSQISLPPSPSTSNDPISTQIAIAHLKCQPSNSTSSHLDRAETATITTTPNPSESFRILSDQELVIPPSCIDQQDHSSCSEFISSETKFFTQRHRQSEMIEKRSKKLEKEKLLHERFKLKNRLDLLMNGSGPDWKSIRTLTLRRIKEDELRQRSAGNLTDHLPRETELEKVERMRRIMIQETEETLKRYDKLLDTRKISKPVPVSEVKPSTPSKPQIKSTKSRASPKASKRKSTHHTCSDQEHHQNGKLAVQPPIPKLKSVPGSAVQKARQPSRSIIKTSDLQHSNGPQSTSSSSPVTLPQSPHIRHSQYIKTEEPTPQPPPPPPLRDSLYDSVSIRRLAMDDHFVNGQKRVGRSTYALGCKLPDMSKIQLDYLSRLQAMASERHASSYSTPFDRPERVLPTQQDSSSKIKNEIEATGEDVDEVDDDGERWIEFNPTVNEEKEIICHQSEFGSGSKFFELDDELEYLEEQKWTEFQMKQLGQANLESLSESSLRQMINGGKSIRKLIEERISSWKE